MQSLLLVRVAACLLGVGVLLTVVGLATDMWSSLSIAIPGFAANSHAGLWKYCSDLFGPMSCSSYNDVPSWFKAVRAMVILSVLAGVVALVITILWALTLSITEKKIIRLLAMMAAFISAGLGLLGVIIYGAEHDSDTYLGWSFALTVVGALVTGIGGAMLFMPLREASSPQ